MTVPAPIPVDETRRLARLKALAVLDTEAEPVFDALTRAASIVCGTPIGLISLIDSKRQWFKSNLGLEGVSETPRDVAFCAHAILQDDIFIVPDASQDARFRANPLVTDDPNIRFYAGAPLIMNDGAHIGTLCVIDRASRTELDDKQKAILRELARAAVEMLEQREQAHYLSLSSSETKFRALSEFSPLGVFHADAQGAFSYTNERWQEIFGLTLGESLGDGWLGAVLAQDRDAVRAAWQRGVEAGTDFDMEFRLPAAEAGVRIIRMQSRSVDASDGSHAGSVGVVSDISARKQDEQRLRTSEERQQRALEASGLALWDFDMESGNVYLSPEWAAMMGGAPEPTICTYDELTQLVPDEDRMAVLATVGPMLKGEVPNYSVEHRVKRPDGSLIWIQSEGRVVQRDEQGNAVRIVGTNKNITERQEVLAELKRTTSLLQAVLDAATTVGIVCVDREGLISLFNRGAEQMLGYTAAEAAGHTAAELYHDPVELEQRSQEMARALGRPLRPGEVFAHESVRGREREWTNIRKDGTRFQTALSLTAVRASEGSFLGYLGTFRDVTQQREYEQSLRAAREAAEQAAQAKSAFLATMSHEIRTPMNGVIGMTSLLLDTKLTDEQREFTEVIRQCGEVLLVVINDILDYSKIESGNMELEILPFAVHEAVESSIELLGERARERQIDLMYQIEPGVTEWLMGDLTRVRQVLVNLISNAVKFTPAGEVFVSVRELPAEASVDSATDARKIVEFCVRDSGIGIPADKLSRLFRPFSQVDSSTSRKYGGTGLGLAICKRLVEAMGGEIRAESDGVSGTRFYFTIRAEAATAPPVQDKPPAADLRGRRILVVDDNSTNLRILAAQSEHQGLIHRCFSSAVDALECVRSGELFDIVLTDMQMPGMDGVSFARELRALQPTLPVVLLSSMKFASGEAQGLFSAVLMKPARQAALFDALARAIPQTRPIAPVSKPRSSQFDDGMAAQMPLRILLAEDNEVNQKVALRMLKGFGYLADVAANGIEVIDALKRQPYDLVLMDVHMPEMDGIEATRHIVRDWPKPERPRIVAMSASALREDTEAALAAGMDDYIVKPVSIEALKGTLSTSARQLMGRNGPAAA